MAAVRKFKITQKTHYSIGKFKIFELFHKTSLNIQNKSTFSESSTTAIGTIVQQEVSSDQNS